MGIIYEAVRKLSNELDGDDYNNEYDNDFIDFPNFLEVLELYSSDDKLVIANYLSVYKDFLELDYYQLNDEYKMQKYMYDYDHGEKIPDIFCPTESFLDDVNVARLSDYDHYYWNIDELLSLECISAINLDREAFDACYDAMFIEASTALQYKIENAKLKNQIDVFNKRECNDTPNNERLTGEPYQQIDEIEKQLKQAHADNDLLRKEIEDNKELEPSSIAAVTRLLNVLFYKANYEISAHSGTLNKQLIEYSKHPSVNTSISKGFLTPWLKRVQQLRIETKTGSHDRHTSL